MDTSYIGIFGVGVLLAVATTCLVSKLSFFKLINSNGEKIKGKKLVVIGVWLFFPFIYGEQILGIIGSVLIIIGISSAFNWYSKNIQKEKQKTELIEGENLLVTERFENSKKARGIFTVLAIVCGGILAIVFFSLLPDSFFEYEDKNYLSNLFNVLGSFIIVPLTVVLIKTIGNIVVKLLENIELTITDMRVFGYTAFTKRIDLPIDSITAVGLKKIFKTIVFTTASGSIKFSFLVNCNKFHSEISRLLVNRQNKSNPSNATIIYATPSEVVQSGTSVVTEQTSSNYSDVKKLKELLDMGAITPEEFERKKKELLDL